MDLKKSIIILVLVTLASFLPVLSANFVNWDDDGHILRNKMVTEFSVGKIADIFFTANTVNSTYIPLTTLSWAAEYSLFGKNPLAFHVTDLFLHIGIVLLVFALARRFGLGAWGAFAAALVFAVHPSRVENVAWATARKDLLYGLFYLLAIWKYLEYLERLRRDDAVSRPVYCFTPYAVALGFGLLSILSKPMALSLPWILLLIDWMRGRRFSTMMLLDKLPFFLVMEPIAWVTYSQNTRPIGFSFPDGFLVWFWSAAFYIHKFLWPGTMSPVYGLPDPVTFTNSAYWGSLAVLGITGVVLWRWGRNRWLVFALSFYFLSSFFLWRFDWRDISVVADRFLYVPSFAACLALGAVADHFQAKAGRIRQLAVAAFAMMILAWGVIGFNYAFAWQDGYALWSSVTENSPALAFAYNNRGSLCMLKGEDNKALEDFHKAILVASRARVYRDGKTLLPPKAASQYAMAHFNMGLLSAKKEDYENALKHFNTAIYYDMEKPDYYTNRGVVMTKLGRMDNALADYTTALSLNSDFFEARFNRGLYYYKLGDKKSALADFENAIASTPMNPEGFMQAGRIYYEDGRLKEALKMFNGAVKAEPDNAQAYYDLGCIYGRMGNRALAQESFSKAQLKWLKDPTRYTLPGLDPKDAKIWAERFRKQQ